MRGDPQQELFTAIRQALIAEYGEGDVTDVTHSGMVYDSGLPPDSTPYPFIYLADTRWYDDMGNKSVVLGRAYQDIHIWHDNPRRRGEVSAMALRVKEICRGLTRSATYCWRVLSVEQQIINDNSEVITNGIRSVPLMHCVITISYQLLG